MNTAHVAIGLLLSTAPAYGQDAGGDDLEYRQITIEAEEEKPLTVGGTFETAWYEYNNLDFRQLDESSDQAILDSDDRGAFAFTGMGLELAYRIDPHLSLVTAASHRGLWGDDQIGNVNAFGGFVYFPALYVDAWLPTAGERSPRFRIGRQYYEIGGLGGAPDYVLSDVIDALRVDLPLGAWGNVVLLPANLFSSASNQDGANFVSYIGQSESETFNFRGDTLTRRHGAVLEITPGEVVEARAYGFYTDIGARGTGSDITYDGLLGNFSDNDWVANFGARTAVALGPVDLFAHLDVSHGIDRKELVAQDVDSNGVAWGGGVLLDTEGDDLAFRAAFTYFEAVGGGYSGNGLQFSHGYVGMKARQMGGTLANRFLGWHPTAYVGMFGIDDNPHDTSRKSGSRVLHANVGGDLPGPLWLRAAWWMMQDKGKTFFTQGDLDTIQPPFGYARAEFAAQERLGKLLGHELNLDLGVDAGEHLEVFVNGAMLLGTSYYAVPVARVAGSALGSTDPATPWAAFGGTRVTF